MSVQRGRQGWIIGAILTIVVSLAQGATMYEVTDLGSFRPNSTNVHGDLVGEQDGQSTICLAGEACLSLGFGVANDISDTRVVVGSNGGGGWVWQPDTGMQLLPEAHVGAFTEPLGINEAGIVVGRSYGACDDVGCLPIEAFASLPPYDRLMILPGLGGWDSEAWKVNDDGVIVGSGHTLDGVTHAMRCTLAPLECLDLGAFPGQFYPNGLGSSQAFGLNHAGVAVGWSTHLDHFLVGVTHTDATGLQALGVREDWAYSVGHGIHDHGAMVGRASVRIGADDQRDAAVYWDPHGTPHMLTERLQDVPEGERWELLQAGAIAHDGRILALGFHWSGEAATFKGVVLHPVVPIPAPVAALEVEPLSGEAPLTITATSLSSGAIDTTSWDFGEGTTSPEPSTTHTYTSAGAYTVTLTVEGPGGRDQASVQVMVTAPPEPEPAPPLPPGRDKPKKIDECKGLKGQEKKDCMRQVVQQWPVVQSLMANR